MDTSGSIERKLLLPPFTSHELQSSDFARHNGLPFLDWMQIAMERYALGLRANLASREYLDVKTGLWHPFLGDKGHMLDMPLYCEGGKLARFYPFTTPVASLVSPFYYSSRCWRVHLHNSLSLAKGKKISPEQTSIMER